MVAQFVLAHLGANAGHAAGDLVPRHGGVYREVPFIAGKMEVRVADAAVEDFDPHILRANVPAVEGEGGERRGGAGGGKAGAGEHCSRLPIMVPIGMVAPVRLQYLAAR